MASLIHQAFSSTWIIAIYIKYNCYNLKKLLLSEKIFVV